jgi:nucleoside-triphosphatase THEP1
MIYILTGPIHSGKTTALKRIIHELRKKKIKIGGFITESIWKNNECKGYNLIDLKEEKSLPFIRRTGEKEWQKIGPYFFIPESLDKAKNIIIQNNNSNLLIVDEVGPLEISGKGLWPALKHVIFYFSMDCLLVVRINVIENILNILSDHEVKVFNFQSEDLFVRMVNELTAKCDFSNTSGHSI